MVFRLYVLPRFGAVPLDAITQREVRAWVTSLTVKGLAPATVHKAYQLFAKTMTAAVDGGMLAQSPCRGVALPKVEHEEMRYLNPAEIACLAEAIRPGYRAPVLVGAYGGLRIGELAGLRRSRVDLLRGTVEIAEIITEVGGRLRVGPPKTRASRRTVGLPRAVVEELAAHMATTAPPDAFVLPPQGRAAAGHRLPRSHLAASDQERRAGRPPHPRPSPHGRRPMDRSRRQPQGSRLTSRAYLGELHPGSLRPPLSGVGCGST
jgi:integrase